MENNDIISFIVPIISILIGIYVKNSSNEYDSFMKKKMVLSCNRWYSYVFV